MTWILVLYIYAGAMASGDSVSLLSIPGYTSEADCRLGGEASKPLVANSTKNLKFVCLPKKN